MDTHLGRRWLLLLALGLQPATTALAQSAAPDPLRLIERLGDVDFHKREAASSDLTSSGRGRH